MIKPLNIIILLFLPPLIFGQDFQLRKKIDSSVLVIDKSSNQVLSFSKMENYGNNKIRAVKYQYKKSNGHIDYILRQYSDHDSSVKQQFYTNNSSLIFSTESIAYNYANDSIGWGGAYYFYHGKLHDYETLGHGKSEIDSWDPEKDVRRNYQKAKKDISTHLKTKNGPNK